MAQPMIGTSAKVDANTEMMKQAHIGWVRQGFGDPLEEGPGAAYESFEQGAARLLG